MKKAFLASALAGTVLSNIAAVPALAQSDDTATTSSHVGIEDIVVVARKTAETLQTVPVAVSAFSGESLANQQIVGIQQIQTTTPNLTFSSAVAQPGSATIFMRGQGSSDGLIAIDQAIGVYVNGVYAARSTGGAMDLIDVERVEVLRGPQGTLFGRNTTGGAINVIPNKPSDKFEGSLRIDYGNYDSFLAQGVINVPLSEDIAVRAVYQHREHSGYGRNKLLDTQLGDSNSEYGRISLSYAPIGSKFSALISGEYWTFKSGGELVGLKAVNALAADSPLALLIGACNGNAPIPALNGLQPFCSSVSRGDISDYIYGENGNNNIHHVYANTPAYGRSDSYGATGTLQYEFSDAAILKSTTAWRGVDMESRTDNDGTPYLITGGIDGSFGNIINQDQFSQELQLSGTVSSFDYILGGFYFVENGLDQSRSASLFPLSFTIGRVDGTVRNQSLAGYGQIIANVTDTVRITGGVRYTEDKRRLVSRNRDIDFVTNAETASLPLSMLDGDPNDPFRATFNRSFNYWSYLVSADWQVDRGAFLYAKTSRSQRSGGFNTRAVAGGVPPVSFLPEVVTDYEVGAKLDLFDRRVRLNLALFNADVKNVQRNLIGTAEGNRLVAGVDNAAEARLRGFEGELTIVPADGLTFGFNMGFTDASYKKFINNIDGSDWSDAKFSYAPRYTVGLTGDYHQELGNGTLRLHADYGWRSAQYASPTALSALERVGLTPAEIKAGNAAIQATSRIPSYGTLNARIGYTFNDPDVEIALFARNITKEAYFTRLLGLQNTALGVTAYTPGDPRTYGVSLTHRFGR